MTDIKENENKKEESEIALKESNEESKTEIQSIINDYGYASKRTIMAILCFCFTQLAQGVVYTYYSIYIIPLQGYLDFGKKETQIIGSIFFLAVGTGAFLSGLLSWKISRPLLIKILFGLILFFNLLMGVIKNIYSFTIFRCLIGFTIGILSPIEWSICAEYLPTMLRALTLAFICIFYFIGQLINSMVMKFIMPNLEAKNIPYSIYAMEFTLFAAFLFNLIFIEDSPRNLLKNPEKSENVKRAFEILNDMRIHSEKLPLTENQEKEIINELSVNLQTDSTEDNYASLLNITNRRLSLLLGGIRFLNSMIGGGIGLVYTLIVKFIHSGDPNSSKEVVKEVQLMAFLTLVSPIIAGTLCEVKYLGRIRTIYLANCLSAFCIFISGIFTKYFWIFASLCIIFHSVSSDSAVIYSAEAYTTILRNRALGVFSAISRIGAFLSQIVFIQLYSLNSFAPIYFTLIANLVVGSLAFFLPFETYGADLDNTNTNKEKLKENKEDEEILPCNSYPKKEGLKSSENNSQPKEEQTDNESDKDDEEKKLL